MTEQAESYGRVVWSREAEEGLLACALRDAATVVPGCIQRGMTAESFHLDKHRTLWEALRGLYDRGEEIDEITVCAVLQALARLEEVGGQAEVFRLGGVVDTTSAWRAYCGVVLDRELQRRALRLAEQTAAAAREPAGAFAELVERLQPVLTELGSLSLVEERENLRAVSERLRARAASVVARGGELPEEDGDSAVIRTPWAYFDEKYGPFSAKDDGIVVVAARPSVGKSVWVRNLMRHVVLHQDLPVVGFLLEMDREQWLDLMAAEVAGVNLKALSDEPYDRLEAYRLAHEALGELVDERLFLFDRDMTIEAIEARCRFLKQRVGEIGLVVVDYLQLIEIGGGGKRYQNRENEVAEISRRLKKLQKELGCVFPVACQINRSAEQGERDPRLSDLRESGAIEQDADRVIFLHRPKLDHAGNVQQGGRRQVEVHFIQAKNRNGPLFKARFQLWPYVTTFMEEPGSKKVSDRPEEKRQKKGRP